MAKEEGFEILEHITWADVAFKAKGSTLSRMFENAARAVMQVMVKLDTVEPILSQKVDLEEEDIEHLLYSFLSEIVYYKDADQLLFSEFNVQIDEENGKYLLAATMKGEKLDPVKHTFGTDVKAITLHNFEVKKTAEGWECQVVVDV